MAQCLESYSMSQYVFTMNRVGKIVPPKRHILKDISLSFFPGAKIGVLGLNGSGKSPQGNWITFRELTGGPSRYAHFQQRCEKPLKRIADTYTDLFKDMLEIFDGKHIVSQIDSDISIVYLILC